ncbi:hypothetical protein AAF712_012132 [Marasmius tenuissimus]|uniref:Uncharacterized protein n=1 Tax=Marasmius tenuissimus TaxID=585030 RepID=A0ABR2ZIN8_9AGAR
MPPLTCNLGSLLPHVARTDRYFNQAVLTIRICRELEGDLTLTTVQFKSAKDTLERISRTTKDDTSDPFKSLRQCLPRRYEDRWEEAKRKDFKKQEVLRVATEKLEEAIVGIYHLEAYFASCANVEHRLEKT